MFGPARPARQSLPFGQLGVTLGFTAEEVDYLDSRAESEARHARESGDDGTPNGATGSSEQAAPSSSSPKPRSVRQPVHPHR